MNQKIILLIVFFTLLLFSAGCIYADQETEIHNASDTDNPEIPTNHPDIEFSAIPLLMANNDPKWMETNASYIAKIALKDRQILELIDRGGEIEGVLFSCHSSPKQYYSPCCAPALRIRYNDVTLDILVDEEKGEPGEYIIEVPSGSIVSDEGNRTMVTYNGEVILDINMTG